MKILATFIYFLTFTALLAAVCGVVAADPSMAPFLLLLLPMAIWAAFDVLFIWKDEGDFLMVGPIIQSWLAADKARDEAERNRLSVTSSAGNGE